MVIAVHHEEYALMVDKHWFGDVGSAGLELKFQEKVADLGEEKRAFLEHFWVVFKFGYFGLDQSLFALVLLQANEGSRADPGQVLVKLSLHHWSD